MRLLILLLLISSVLPQINYCNNNNSTNINCDTDNYVPNLELGIGQIYAFELGCDDNLSTCIFEIQTCSNNSIYDIYTIPMTMPDNKEIAPNHCAALATCWNNNIYVTNSSIIKMDIICIATLTENNNCQILYNITLKSLPLISASTFSVTTIETTPFDNRFEYVLMLIFLFVLSMIIPIVVVIGSCIYLRYIKPKRLPQIV